MFRLKMGCRDAEREHKAVCGVREKLTQIAGSVAVHSGVCELNDVLVSTPRSSDQTVSLTHNLRL